MNLASLKVYLFCLLFISSTYAQSLSGISGLMIVPDTEISADQLKIGATFINTSQIGYSTHNAFDQKYAFVYYSSIGFLPFLEFSFRGMKVGAPGEALGDRIVSMKIKVFADTELFPAVSIGVQDFYYTIRENKTNNFHIGYVVISKRVKILNGLDMIAGYGTRIFTSAGTQLNGLFYGVKLSVFPSDFMCLFIENDSERFNSGLKLTFWRSLSIQVGLYDIKYPIYGFSYSYKL